MNVYIINKTGQNAGKAFSKVKLIFQRALLSYARANQEASFSLP